MRRMFKEGKGRMLSYFTITIVKNHLILKNNGNYKDGNKIHYFQMHQTWNPENDFYKDQLDNEYSEFKKMMLMYWDKNLNSVFNKKRDLQILADSILELFRRSEHIENFNKKHLYLLIREMTDCKTHYITKVVNVMKQHQKKLLNDFLEHGEPLDSRTSPFWKQEEPEDENPYLDNDYL